MNARIGTDRRLRSRLTPLLALLMIAVLAACQPSASQPAEEPAPAEAAEPAAETQAEPQVEAQTEAESPAAAGLQTFVISPEGTEARFLIDEVLMGQDKTVVGVTPDVSGEIRLDPQNPSAAEIGPITINARDFTTDADRRNGAIRRFILQSDRDEFQYIVFTPTAIAGMPDAVTVGEPFSFQVTGDLAIRDVTHAETFDVTITANSESELSGLATTTVLRGDYALTIPQVPSVTGVEEEVRLEFEFVAQAQ